MHLDSTLEERGIGAMTADMIVARSSGDWSTSTGTTSEGGQEFPKATHDLWDECKRKREEERSEHIPGSRAWWGIERKGSFQRIASEGLIDDGGSEAGSSTGGASRLIKRMRIHPELMKESNDGGPTGSGLSTRTNSPAPSARFSPFASRPPTIEETHDWERGGAALTSNGVGYSVNGGSDSALHTQADEIPMSQASDTTMVSSAGIAEADGSASGSLQYLNQPTGLSPSLSSRTPQRQQHVLDYRLTIPPHMTGHPHPYNQTPYSFQQTFSSEMHVD
ncbi:hypothetical protein K437DRAFT_258038 [Tilletiaria anomala UBC 951]|uniref:Uncharacterized protein n=1 Tax=Tilletiaria anomala (strain ATCC 24038 / CBS 436.72 / UBC 951) TaxID=1037660 RepID=A0A066VJR0_TILAU|nr:uncharacterized protein K437DRAFT_258038 [Tilletiaria anomala UBC 951]KDN41957.1 hypothetical protein K437DRAFT_258038 [Tilletiaria anomala UBC 951]